MTQSQLLLEINTHLHPCSIETIDFNSERSVFACGYYELQSDLNTSDENNDSILHSSSQKRIGCIELFQYTYEQSDHVEKLQVIDVPGGVLDMKIHQYGAIRILGCVLSNGMVQIYKISDNSTALSYIDSMEDQSEGLFLSLSWCAVGSISQLLVSTQSGSIICYQFDGNKIVESNKFSSVHSKFGESLPCWIVANDIHSNGHRFISGGDDCMMRLWDLRSDSHSPIFKDSKTHQAGVTSAQWHHIHQDLFVTGSYDEFVRLWDIKMMKKPILEIPSNGGVWRSKWMLTDKSHEDNMTLGWLMCSSMQVGSGIYALHDDKYQTYTNFFNGDKDKHLAYGIDVLYSTKTNYEANGFNFILASCSFYENRIDIWHC